MTDHQGVASIASAPPVEEDGATRRTWFGIAMLVLLCVLTAPFFVDPMAGNAPLVRNGTVSYAEWGPLDRPVSLRGDWQLTWRIPLGDRPAGSVPPVARRVPGVWDGTAMPGGGRLPSAGVATYALTLEDLPAGRYRLHVPIIYAANRVAIDGQIVSQRGQVGTDAASTRYDWRAHDIAFESRGGDVRVTIDIAAFLHRDNGMEVAPVLGLTEAMQYWVSIKWAQEFLTLVALILLGIYSLSVFLYRRSDRASLFFAISCFGYMPVSAIMGFDNILSMLFPGMPFGLLLSFLYIPAEIALAAFLAYVNALYPNEAFPRLFKGLMAVILTFCGLQAITLISGDTVLASRFNTAFLPIILAIFLYINIVLVRAIRRQRAGAVIFLLGVAIFFVTVLMLQIVAYGIIPRDQVLGMDFTGYGMLLLLFSHIVILAERWSLAIVAAEQMNNDLRQLLDVNLSITSEMQLEALLTKIVNVTSKILHADRSSLLLIDEKGKELRAVVAEGVTPQNIRFPADRGLAGHAFQTGEIVNVADAYADPRFQRSLDEETGYHTRSILSMPVVARDGRRLGVMQALNRQGDGPFTPGDIERMGAFAAQAAVAIDNATLFNEVVASRNYNESILRSMSSGVVTLDRDLRITKLNDAACSILGLDIESAMEADAVEWIQRTNAWAIPELEAVLASGEAKTLLDVDVTKAGTGEIISANISIVPLLSGEERVGVLILVEDISEGKRLQGAMRRFMTQKVADQVLERRDELLFGTACEASVLFADIRNFTTISEVLEPRATVEMLNEVFTELFEAVSDSDGVLDKYIGDAVMAVYGAPLSSGNDAANAVASAARMQEMIASINARRIQRGQAALRLGVGIASGEVVAGTVGSPKRMDYTVIGDSVNLAARLEDATKYYQVDIIVCESTAAMVTGTARLRELDLIRVRGRKRAAKIFQVLHRHPSRDTEAMLVAYQRGRDFLAARRWKEAQAAFADAVALDAADRPAAIMLDRAHAAQAEPPEGDWDGVWNSPHTVLTLR